MKKMYGIWKKWMLAGVVAAAIFAGSMSAVTTEAWIMESGQCVNAEGTPIVGALEKGTTVTKRRNRASESTSDIDWAEVRADGVPSAMTHPGYHNDIDPYYSMNINGATIQGIKVGALFYTQALGVQTVIDEANHMLALVKNYPISHPTACDAESRVLLDGGLTKQQTTDQIDAFCSVTTDVGHRPVVYANNMWLMEHVDASQIPYDTWYARYGTINRDFKDRIIWQCDQYDEVDGIVGDVIIKLPLVDYGTLIPVDSWEKTGGQWYYMKNYVKQIGWVQAGDKWYYMDSNGVMIHDTTLSIDRKSYTFGPDRAMQQHGDRQKVMEDELAEFLWERYHGSSVCSQKRDRIPNGDAIQ